MGVRYKLKKLKVRINQNKGKTLDLDDVQKKAYDIIIQMINDKNSKLLIDPGEGRKGIRNKDIFINLKKNKISIVNGVFHYDIPIDDRISEHITEKFYNKLSRTFNAEENKSTAKTKNSLDTIISESKK
jgi:hypothetical protein